MIFLVNLLLLLLLVYFIASIGWLIEFLAC